MKGKCDVQRERESQKTISILMTLNIGVMWMMLILMIAQRQKKIISSDALICVLMNEIRRKLYHSICMLVSRIIFLVY